MARSARKSASIVLIESDDVVQHILPLKTAEIRLLATDINRLTYTPSSLIRDKCRAYSDTSDSDDGDNCSQMNVLSPAIRNDDSESMFGKEIFQFRTPKKSGQMAVKARESCSPATPKLKQASRTGSPKSTSKSPGRRVENAVCSPTSHKRSLSDTGQSTPKRLSRAANSRNYKRMESSTPYRLRKRNLNLEHPDSSSDDSVDESSDDMEEEGIDDDENDDVKQASSYNRSETRDMNMAATAEAYFDLHSTAPLTSDRTLSALDGPRLDVDTIREILRQTGMSHHKQVDILMNKHTGLFRKWMFNMCCGYNILLHGLGSKRTLLEKFREQHLSKFSHLVINGYFPSLTVKHILNSITEEILESSKGFSNIYNQVEFIRNAYKKLDEDFYLVIHNIDGVLLRSDKSQAVLSHLSEIRGFHIIASVDHINAVFMWDQNRYFRFHWLWYETPTFLPYEAENGYENSLMVQQSGTLALSSIVHVMRSLTPNARQIFLILAEYQLEAGDSPHYAGMSFQNLYQKCREAFLVNSDLTLQAQLVEFKDHKLIRSKKNYEGIEHLVIPLDKATLKEFLQEHKDGHR